MILKILQKEINFYIIIFFYDITSNTKRMLI